MAQLDDQCSHQGGALLAAAGRGNGLARAGRALALGGRLDRRHERHTRRHDSPAQLLRRSRLAGTRANADAGDRGPARGGDQGLQARALLAGRRGLRGRRRTRLRGALSRRLQAEDRDRAGGPGDRRAVPGPAGHRHEARAQRAARALAAAVRPDLAAARREHALRVLGQTHAGRGPALLRGAQGAHLSAHQLALSDQRHDPRDQADGRARRRAPRVREGRAVRARARSAAARQGRQRRQGQRPPRDHPDPLRTQPGENGLR